MLPVRKPLVVGIHVRPRMVNLAVGAGQCRQHLRTGGLITCLLGAGAACSSGQG